MAGRRPTGPSPIGAPGRTSPGRGADPSAVTAWLLEPGEPSVRVRALLDLEHRAPNDPDVRASLAELPRHGWVAELLTSLRPSGIWEPREPRSLARYVDFLYYPKFRSTNWKALVLSDLGAPPADPRVQRLARQIFDYKLRLGSPFNFYHEEVCASGNTARILTRFGFSEDPRVRRLFDWLLDDQREDGGWNCSQGTPGTLDAWEALAAFAAVPAAARTQRMRDAIARGAEFYLERQLMREGSSYPPWLRLHYPQHYFYDILVGLDLLTGLGYAGDRRLRPAAELLRKKRRADGSWSPDRTHPDVPPKYAGERDLQKAKAFALEAPGRPGKWITLLALRSLRRIENAS